MVHLKNIISLRFIIAPEQIDTSPSGHQCYEPVLVNIFINSTDKGIVCALSDNLQISGMDDTPGGCDAVQTDPNWPENSFHGNVMWSNRNKMLNLGWGNPWY